MSKQIPITLKRILGIYLLVRKLNLKQEEAVEKIAQKSLISPHDIISISTRRLHITHDQFTDLFHKNNKDKFKGCLIESFQSYRNQIEKYLEELNGLKLNSKNYDSLELVKSLFPEEIKFLMNRQILKNIGKKFKGWETRTDIPDDIKRQFNRWVNEIEMVF
jgi:hypothetical protein